MRVSQSMLFGNLVNRMSDRLSTLMELNMQAASQKRINKPSDDPAGTYRVLDHRRMLRNIEQYDSNISTAKGWLKQGDETLLQVNTTVTRLKELAEQGATGTLSRDNREQISYEVRELFHQLVGLSNSEFEGKSIFAGHKVKDPAFVEVLAVRDNDGGLDGARVRVEGSLNTSAIIQALDGDGTTPLAAGDAFRYSLDGGRSFTDATVGTDSDGNLLMDLGGARVIFDSAAPPTFSAVTGDTNDTSGSGLWVHPSARYMGDDNISTRVDQFGAAFTVQAKGSFSENALVRLDGWDSTAGQVQYSVSSDGGQSWDTGKTATAPSGSTSFSLKLSGGFLDVTVPTDVDTDVAAGQQFVVRPDTADISLEISSSESVIINSVGRDIFGGLEADAVDPAFDANVFADESDPGRNLFDTVGRLVAALETNNQEGCAVALEDLRSASQHILNHAAGIAGRENRLDVAESLLSNLKYNETERLSAVEDADMTELVTRLAQQEVGYQAVLKSSSTIMNISLLNYI